MNYEIDTETWKKGFVDKLNKLLYEKGVTVNTLANAICIDYKTVHNYFNGKSVPTAVNLQKLARYFQVSIDYLLGETDEQSDFDGRIIKAIAFIIRNMDTSISTATDDSTLSLHIHDETFAMIAKELFFSRRRDDYKDVVDKLDLAYGRMKLYKKRLVEYSAFEKMIRHEYIYHDLDGAYFDCREADTGDAAIAVDDWDAYDIVVQRQDEWEDMTTLDRESWWEEYSKKSEQ